MPTSRRHLVAATVREFKRAKPFKPFEIRVAGGERHKVPHPDYVFISPFDSFVIVFGRDGSPHQLNAPFIEKVGVRKGRKRR
jgi:hypothetical protein